ncbi:MAG: hypothetical protein PHH08_03190 [Candidatus ainarchaeum sp.]|nr:hypothetical protein [Candidatus ainarchaeum sp.]
MVSIFQALADFFKKLFSKKQSSGTEGAEEELRLSEIEDFLKGSTKNARASLDSLVAKKFSEIKHILRQLGSLLGKLDSADVETENARLGKIVETSRRHSSHQLSSLVEKLVPPNLQDLEAVRLYCLESEAFLNKEIPAIGKNLVYTSIVLKEDMKSIGSLVEELQKNFSDLNREFAKNKQVFLGSFIKSRSEKIAENTWKISLIKNSLNSTASEAASLEKIILDSKTGLEKLRNSPEAKELLALEEKKSSLLAEKKAVEQEIFEKTTSVEKPMRKLANIASKQKTALSREHLDFLQDFLHNPVIALKRDPKGEYFKALLKELDSQFSAGNLELKEKDFEKKQALLQELLEFDFFENFFWKSNNIEIELQKVEKELRHSDFSKRLFEEEKSVREKQSLLDEMKKSLSAQKNEISELESKNLEILRGIQAAFSDSFPGRKISAG